MEIGTHIKVGIFVSIGILAFLISVLLLGGDKMFLTRTYELKATFREVQGLGAGSVVSLAGVPVGNVKSIRFDAETNRLEVTVGVDKKFQNRITENCIASVKTQGALGDRYIFINPGPEPSGRVLQNGEFLRVAESADFLDALSQKSADIAQIGDVIKQANLLLKNLNDDGASRKLVENIIRVTQAFHETITETRGLVTDIRGANGKGASPIRESITHLESILQKIDQGQGTLGALINDPSLHERIKTLLGDSPRNQFLRPLIIDTIKKSESKESR